MLITGSVRELGDARALDTVILDANGNPITSFTVAPTPAPGTANLSTVPANTAVTMTQANPFGLHIQM